MAALHSLFARISHALLLGFLMATSAAWGQDSLWVTGRIEPGQDSLNATLHWQFGNTPPPAAMDTAWMPISRNGGLTCWGEGTMGRAQIEQAWPRYRDSVLVTLMADSAGLVLVLATDTLVHPWTPAGTGCFPATPNSAIDRWLAQQEGVPFESRRHQAALAWISGQCLTTESLGRLMDTFDDEARRLSLLQAAPVVRPEALHTLSNRLFSSRYRAAFDGWIEQRP